MQNQSKKNLYSEIIQEINGIEVTKALKQYPEPLFFIPKHDENWTSWDVLAGVLYSLEALFSPPRWGFFAMTNNISTTADSYKNCPRCKSTNLIRQTGDDEPTCHYGRLKCGDCEKHIQWLSDPAVDERVADMDAAINELLILHRGSLSEWDKTFLQSNLGKRHLSPRQKLQLHRIYERCTNIPYFEDDELGELDETARKYAPSMKVTG